MRLSHSSRFSSFIVRAWKNCVWNSLCDRIRSTEYSTLFNIWYLSEISSPHSSSSYRWKNMRWYLTAEFCRQHKQHRIDLSLLLLSPLSQSLVKNIMDIIEKCMRSSDLSGLHALRSTWDCLDPSNFSSSRLMKSKKTLLMTAAREGLLDCCKFLLSIDTPHINTRCVTISLYFAQWTVRLQPDIIYTMQKFNWVYRSPLCCLPWTWKSSFSFARSWSRWEVIVLSWKGFGCDHLSVYALLIDGVIDSCICITNEIISAVIKAFEKNENLSS